MVIDDCDDHGIAIKFNHIVHQLLTSNQVATAGPVPRLYLGTTHPKEHKQGHECMQSKPYVGGKPGGTVLGH